MFQRPDYTCHDEESRKEEEAARIRQERRERFEIANNFETFWSIVADAGTENEYKSQEMLSHLFSLFRKVGIESCGNACTQYAIIDGDLETEASDSDPIPSNAKRKREEWLSIDFEEGSLPILRLINSDIQLWEKRKFARRLKRMKFLRSNLFYEAQVRSEDRLSRLERYISFL